MTYFSKFDLNPQRRASRKLLSNPRAMHASVLALFPPESEAAHSRVLWRLDSDHPRHTLYVSSPHKPDFAHLIEQAGWESSPGQTTEYSKFLQRVTNGSEWLFRLQANPTKAVRNSEAGHRSRGTIIPLITEDQQIAWLLSRAPHHGFTIATGMLPGKETDEHLDLRVLENVEQVLYKQETSVHRKVTLRKTIFEGRLTVTDEMALRRALVEGIGRAKSYGFGLLTLRKP